MDFDVKHYESLEDFVDKSLSNHDYNIGRLRGNKGTWQNFYTINPDIAFTMSCGKPTPLGVGWIALNI